MTSTSSEAVVVRDLGHAAFSVGHPDPRRHLDPPGRLHRARRQRHRGNPRRAGRPGPRAWPGGALAAVANRGPPTCAGGADRAAEAQAAATERARTDVLATQQSPSTPTAAVERCDADLATRQAEPRRRRGARPAHRRGRAPARGGHHGRPRRRGAPPRPRRGAAHRHRDRPDAPRRPAGSTPAVRRRTPCRGAVLETEVTTVDATIESALGPVREVLAR